MLRFLPGWNLIDFLCHQFGWEGDVAFAATTVGIFVCIVIGYLLGSLNSAIIISRLFFHEDIREQGSKNAGATNMLRTYGTKYAVMTMVLDMLKAAIATTIGFFVCSTVGAPVAGFFCVFGHMFPLYYRFKGGKGVACFAMVGLVIHPLVFIGLAAIFLIVLIGTHFVSLASVMAAFMFPFLIKWFSPIPDSLHVAMGCIAAMLVVFMHRENLKRIWENQEPRLDFESLKLRKKSKKPREEEKSSSEDDTNE